MVFSGSYFPGAMSEEEALAAARADFLRNSTSSFVLIKIEAMRCQNPIKGEVGEVWFCQVTDLGQWTGLEHSLGI